MNNEECALLAVKQVGRYQSRVRSRSFELGGGEVR